jgi:hypothetical protein
MSRDEKSFAKIPTEFQEKYRKHFGKVGMRFVCDQITLWNYDQAFDESMGVFIDKFGYDITDYELGKTCLTYEEFEKYGNTNNLYGLNTTDLVVYDEPRELSEFYTEGDCDCMNCKKCYWFDRGNGYNVENDCNLAYKCVELHKSFKPIIRPPQSWCYIEPRQTAD